MNNYIGKKLTLISKSDIRYEGTLYSLDPQDSSLTLTGGASRLPIRGSWNRPSFSLAIADLTLPAPDRLVSAVRSFGTEGRRKEGPQILPSNETYGSIIFKGSDIKDIQISDQAPPQAAAPQAAPPQQQVRLQGALDSPHASETSTRLRAAHHSRAIDAFVDRRMDVGRPRDSRAIPNGSAPRDFLTTRLPSKPQMRQQPPPPQQQQYMQPPPQQQQQQQQRQQPPPQQRPPPPQYQQLHYQQPPQYQQPPLSSRRPLRLP